MTGDILTENFETPTTGYENVWTPSGTVNPVFASPALEGTQSLQLNGTSAEAHILKSFSAASSVYLYFKFRVPNLPSDNTAFMILADAFFNNYLVRIFLQSSGNIFIICGGSVGGPSVGALSANTTYHFWLTYIKGTGANAIANVGFSTDGVRPTSGNNYVSVTDGSPTTDFVYLQPTAGNVGGTWTPIFDSVCLNTTQIGDAVVNVVVSLVGVAANPQIGAGTVQIGSVAPPDTGGSGHGGFGVRLRQPEDKFVYLKGVAADPRIGQVMLRSDMERVYESYSSPIRRAAVQKPAEMPPGMRGLFKKTPKAIPPVVFVYPAPFPKLKTAVGSGTVTAHYEDIDEEVLAMIDLL